MMNMKWTRAMRVNDDEHAGLLFDLSENSAILRALDENMAGINHASRDGNEHPLAIFSENELETVSYPIPKEVGIHLRKINDVMKDNINMVGHMVVPQKRVEVSSEFAGVNGNLIWLNSGGADLLLKVETNVESRAILLKPGFGFCVGKRKKYARVFLSSPEKADDLFKDPDTTPLRAHAMFFGCDRGDKESWRGALNCDVQEQEPGKPNCQVNEKGANEGVDERYRRLGVEPRNKRRNQIRIAPMKGCLMEESFLSGKISIVEKWIKNTLSQAKLNPTPVKFTVGKGIEQPQVGVPFEVLWVNFEFNGNMWNDEVMWDIRYLLIGSKMDRLPGFPDELGGFREKIYISRDGNSERRRRGRRL